MIGIADARGKYLTLRAPARRIVSLVPSQTELLASLGLDHEVIGLTRFCVRPESWKGRKQIVGGTKTLNTDRIRALRPDLILANLEENTRDDVYALDAIAPVFVSDVGNLDGACAMIDCVAQLTGRVADGQALCTGIRSAFAALPEFAPLRTAYLIWEDPIMTVGRDTFIHDMMLRGRFENAFGYRSRYPEISDAQLVDAELDVVLLPDEPFPFKDRHANRFKQLLPDVEVMRVDGQAFSWYGSRLIHTPVVLRDLRRRLGAA